MHSDQKMAEEGCRNDQTASIVMADTASTSGRTELILHSDQKMAEEGCRNDQTGSIVMADTASNIR